MQQLNNFIIITGAITSGKSTLCHDLSGALHKFWNIDGILSFTSKRNFASKEKSLEYNIHAIGTKETLPWAYRKHAGEKFVFFESSVIVRPTSSRSFLIWLIWNCFIYTPCDGGINKLIYNVKHYF